MKKKLIRVSTVPESLLILLRNQLKFLNNHFEVIGIASPGEELDLVSVNEKIRVIPLSMHRRINVFQDCISIIKMYKILKKEKPFIIHSITPKAGLVTMTAGFFAGVPHRIHTFTGLIFPSREGIMRIILMNVDRLICSFATIIIPEGAGVRNDLIKFNITRKNINVIANGNVNGIDLEYFKLENATIKEAELLKSKIGIKQEDIVFTFIGRIVVDKGIIELMEAFKELLYELKNIKLLIVGTYEKLDPLPDRTVKIINDHSEIIKVAFQNDIRPYLALSNVLVLPSYREGFPNVVLQAGAMNLPCIVTDVNGCNEIIKDSINGIIIPPKNIAKLKEAMMSLVLNPEERFNMSLNAREMIVKRYDQKFVWSELLKKYNSLK